MFSKFVTKPGLIVVICPEPDIAVTYLPYVLRDRCNPEPAVKVRDPTAPSGR
jgi:hypothetical protein